MIPRAVGSVVVASALIASVALAQVRARASELASEVGPALLAYAGATHDQGLRALRVNGAKLLMRTGSTADSVSAVLSRQRGACRAADTRLPAVQWRSEAQGVLGCFAARVGGSLYERLSAFVTTGELTALGEPQVTWVFDGGLERRYVLIAAPEPLSLAEMFPQHGDAPGFDVPNVPRPPSARRVLSAVQEGAPVMIVAYQSDLSLEALEPAYREHLEQKGFEVEASAAEDGPALLVRDEASAHVVLLSRDGSGALAVVLPLTTQLQALDAR